MHIQATPDQARAILKAMFGIAAAGPQSPTPTAPASLPPRATSSGSSLDPSVMTPAAAADCNRSPPVPRLPTRPSASQR